MDRGQDGENAGGGTEDEVHRSEEGWSPGNVYGRTNGVVDVDRVRRRS